MESLKKIIIVNFGKMFGKPLYRIALIILSLPVSVITFFVYNSRKKNSEYEKKRDLAAKELANSQEALDLRTEVEEQLQKKLQFFGKSYDASHFKSEADKVFDDRFNEIVDTRFSQNPETNMLKKNTFVSVFGALLDNPLFLLLTIVFGFPMLIMVFLYSNAYTKYIFERLIMMVFVIFGVTFLVFTILYLSPMDAAKNILGNTATVEQVADFNKAYGLDQPYAVQLFKSFKNIVTFDLGISYMGNEDVFSAIMRKFPVTLELTFYSLLLAVGIALPIGIISAIKPNSVYDYVFMFLALLGLSIPNFWLGLILILNCSIRNSLLPATYNINDWRSLVMPAFVLGTGLAATVTRMTRSSMLEVIKQDYIVTAKAKGLSYGKVIIRHALANAMIPIVTVIGLQFGGMLGGSSVTEKVFNVNGIGRYIVEKQFIPDTPAVLAGVVYVAVVISFVNLFVDILYAFLDPRIKSKLKSY